MFQTDLLSIIRNLNTVYKATVYAMLVMLTLCYRGQDRHVLDRSTVHHQESQHCIRSKRYLSC